MRRRTVHVVLCVDRCFAAPLCRRRLSSSPRVYCGSSEAAKRTAACGARCGKDKWGLHSRAFRSLLDTREFQVTLAIRLTPLPMEWENYLLGGAGVSLRSFFAATAIARLCTKAWAVIHLGSTLEAYALDTDTKFGWAVFIMLALLLLSFCLGFVLQRHYRRLLAELSPDV